MYRNSYSYVCTCTRSAGTFHSPRGQAVTTTITVTTNYIMPEEVDVDMYTDQTSC